MVSSYVSPTLAVYSVVSSCVSFVYFTVGGTVSVHAALAADCKGLDNYANGPDLACQGNAVYYLDHLHCRQHGSFYMESGKTHQHL